MQKYSFQQTVVSKSLIFLNQRVICQFFMSSKYCHPPYKYKYFFTKPFLLKEFEHEAIERVALKAVSCIIFLCITNKINMSWII